MAAENIKKYRFKMAAETSSSSALTSDGDVSTTFNDDFFTDAKWRPKILFKKIESKWRPKRRPEVHLPPTATFRQH